ncbi:YidC/Oxa1 family membrane protein insertase [Paenibacillus pasadenensis]|uniref:Membrane protein insertase YidC n=1 Tax=Paenibacillus pasadenensis TaxID=217090 RepID=A0A2N5NC74_9BACL|nr:MULTISPECIES: YidC/Oxa1 family membrane protein insertase [Paenibacillus]PLT47923.1 Inner membrane protein translocase component YidC, short form OxaI-like [Paenibacillus pasadenensis]QGG58501.1 membrane protein insertase YidC [Paenibacillus sp. B01]
MFFSRLASKRKWLVLVSLITLVALLSGCMPNTDHATTTEDLKANGNWWERNVVYYFSYSLDTFADWFGGQYGFAILLMVIIVRTLILPLTLKQYRSSKAMQAIQPELQEIRKKFADNPQKQQEETMKLFQQNKVNPMAGCLPLLIQMPIFIALYNSIYYNSDIKTHEFLWLQLGEPDHWHILPIIAAITTYVQTKMMQKSQPDNPQMQMMNTIMMIFPILILVMAWNFPSALPLYWIYTNIYTIVQNYFLYVRNADKKEPKKEDGGQNQGKGSQKKNKGKGKAAVSSKNK